MRYDRDEWVDGISKSEVREVLADVIVDTMRELFADLDLAELVARETKNAILRARGRIVD